jgi:hypothetical protein
MSAFRRRIHAGEGLIWAYSVEKLAERIAIRAQ